MSMDSSSLLLLLVAVVLFITLCCFYLPHSQKSSTKLPPGPCPLPIFGNLFQLGGIYHATLAKLSEIYGPLMTLKQGSKTTIVVSSSKVAKEILQKYDHIFIRTVPLDTGRALDRYKFSVASLPARSHWRNIRKLYKEQIFSSERLSASQKLRQEKVQQLCDYVQECCINGEAVYIGVATFTTSLNFMSNTLFSIDFANFGSNSSQELRDIVSSLLQVMGSPNLSDVFPVLKVLDPQGLRRQTKFYLEKLFSIFDNIISQRLKERATDQTYLRKNDFLEVLLDLSQQDEDEWSHSSVRHLLLDLFLGGTDTTSSTVEWAMAELLRNPEKKKKARAEIREVLGQSKLVQELDISKLPYLQAVVKETFRLHPPATFIARIPEDDIEINPYILPKNCQIFFNIWAISRDPSLWFNPNSFVPERFFDCEIDPKGHHFELIPFGTGKRICPGMPLADRMLHLMVASFLHNFDWKLEEGMKPEDMDMTERFGFTVQKAMPLKAIPMRTTM